MRGEKGEGREGETVRDREREWRSTKVRGLCVGLLHKINSLQLIYNEYLMTNVQKLHRKKQFIVMTCDPSSELWTLESITTWI